MVAARRKHAGGRTQPTGPHLAIPAEERALDVEELGNREWIKCREWTQRSSYLQVDGFVPYPVELIFEGPRSPNGQPSPAFS